jgi:hypothetical protein
MNTRILLAWGFGFATLVAAACGGSSGGTNGGGSDGGSSSGGGSGSGSSSGASGGCTGTAPQIQCDVCGTTSSETAQCIDNTWECPELPVHCAGPDDASVDAAPDAGPHTDGGFACTACDPQSNYCELSYGPPPNDGGSGVPSESCQPLPACDGGASCACISMGPFCSCADVSGEITVTCPFHP